MTTSQTLQNFPFRHRVRVRWAEVDAKGVVFHAHYANYVDIAWRAYWSARAIPFDLALRTLKADLYVKKSSIEYHASAHDEDGLELGVRCVRIGTSSIEIEACVFRQHQRLASAHVVYVLADAQNSRPCPVPQALREALLTEHTLIDATRASETSSSATALVHVKTGTWSDLGRDASQLRTEVFVQEQKVPQELEWDVADAEAVHAVAYNVLGCPLATGRLLPHDQHTARIGRMAVHRSLRAAGLGARVLRALMRQAQQQGYQRVLLHAQCSAQGFYERFGFVCQGEVFEEAGIDHIEMVCTISDSMTNIMTNTTA